MEKLRNKAGELYQSDIILLAELKELMSAEIALHLVKEFAVNADSRPSAIMFMERKKVPRRNISIAVAKMYPCIRTIVVQRRIRK